MRDPDPQPPACSFLVDITSTRPSARRAWLATPTSAARVSAPALIVALTMMAVLAGCQADESPLAEALRVDRVFLGLPAVSPAERERLSGLTYPVPEDPAARAALERSDIVVRREGGSIRLLNRTIRGYENVRLWLNEQYVGEVARVDIGVNEPLDLRTFINEHGEHFPIAQWLKPDLADKSIHAAMHDPQTGRVWVLTVQPPIED